MRIMLSSLYFIFTLIVGTILFVVVGVQFPTVMADIFSALASVPALFQSWGLPDAYVVWLQALGTGAPIVLLGFVLVTRIVFSLIGAALGLGD